MQKVQLTVNFENDFEMDKEISETVIGESVVMVGDFNYLHIVKVYVYSTIIEDITNLPWNN